MKFSNEDLKFQVKNLPTNPGIYQYFDRQNDLLYIGKAKNLKNRVSSYFVSSNVGYKTNLLVKKIWTLKFIVVDSEKEALLLENQLIKEHQPRYNIQLKDDKTFPWICIKNEPFPRVISTRRYIRDGSEYFGPYTSAYMVRALLDFVRELYPLRTCKLNLSAENISSGKYKICLEYHIGNCLGPCEGHQTQEDYMTKIDQIKKILKGNIHEVRTHWNELMQNASEKFDFELAQKIKEKIELVDKYNSKSLVVSTSVRDVEVYGLLDNVNDKVAYINFLKVNNGVLLQSHTIKIIKQIEETKEDLLIAGILDLKERLSLNSVEIIIPFPIDLPVDENVKMLVPQRGDKKKLLELSMKNAMFFRREDILLEDEQKRKYAKREDDLMEIMKNDLQLDSLPIHIECFDNSNIQGTNPVAACVVFKNGKPSKKEYRHFKVKTVVGPDDFESMREIVYRRYSRLIEEEEPLPQLIIIDGGKGQLSAAVSSIEKLGLANSIRIIGIAKRLEEIFRPNDSVPLYINKNSRTLKVIQNARNEAHRFGITFHRKLRGKESLQSELDQIEGIGPKTKDILLNKYKSLNGIKEASEMDLENLIGKSKTRLLLNAFK